MPYLSELYMHDLDRKVTKALNIFPVFVKLLEVYQANFDEKQERYDLLSSAIRLGEKQMPEIYCLLPPICDKLGIDVPELYYLSSEEPNAFTFGSTQPFICLTSELVEEIPLDLMPSVLAHECGHIACRHTLYHSLATLLAGKIENGLSAFASSASSIITPAIGRALRFWDRCSELSADRAAVLCDGGADKTVDVLLRLGGYDKNINREEFLKQAMDLREFVNDSKSNQFLEQMLTDEDSHPRLATRAYECYEWAQSEQYRGILDGSYTLKKKKKEEDACSEEEVISAGLDVPTGDLEGTEDIAKIQQALLHVDSELERYTNDADKADYALAIASGILSGFLDSLFVGKFSLEEESEWGTEQVNAFVVKVAKTRGYQGDDLAGAIRLLEDQFPIAADKATNQFGGGLQHHLRDFSHHPTLVGLACSILTQFTNGKVFGTDTDGSFKVVQLDDKDLILIGKNFPEKIMFGVVNWTFHLVSDMAGSSGSVSNGGLGTGIPGPFVSLLKELSALPFFQKIDETGHREFSVFVSKLFNGTLLGERDKDGKLLVPHKFDLRAEIGVAHFVGKQTIPVIVNECVVRAIYFIRRLAAELGKAKPESVKDLMGLNWDAILPFRNRTINRMVAVSSITFTVADTTDAVIHAAVESGGNWVLFSGKFLARVNVVGAGRATIAIVKEISNEKKETQLIHEKMILSEAKSALILEQLQEFKAQLEERVSNYLAEDISEFMRGFDFMNQGIANEDSDLVIQGNIIIQKVLGREPQFTSQQEFDALMESDTPLVL